MYPTQRIEKRFASIFFFVKGKKERKKQNNERYKEGERKKEKKQDRMLGLSVDVNQIKQKQV